MYIIPCSQGFRHRKENHPLVGTGGRLKRLCETLGGSNFDHECIQRTDANSSASGIDGTPESQRDVSNVIVQYVAAVPEQEVNRSGSQRFRYHARY